MSPADDSDTPDDDRTYHGHIRCLDGEYGEKLRGELAGIIIDLLHWASNRGDRDEEDRDHCEAA
ncbi:MAG: hypothetical protein GEV07_28465 [Streptosporangiales bacterium]|nr:hypothetical protein [Streptosporangiales bacterium]